VRFIRLYLTISIAFITTITHSGTPGSTIKAQSNGLFFSAGALYGALSDEGINKGTFTQTTTTSGATKAYYPKLNSDWGYMLSIGYKFGPKKQHDLELDYQSLKNDGLRQVHFTGDNSGGAYLVNKLSQIANYGNQYLFGNTTAWIQTNFDFKTGSLVTHHYFQSADFNFIQFVTFYGAKATEFKKSFQASYHGLAQSENGPIFPAAIGNVQDTINYSSKFYGAGPLLGIGAHWFANHIISVGGNLSAALLAGSFKSELRETYRGIPIYADRFPSRVPVSNFYSFNQATDSTAWVAHMFAGNLVVAANFDLANNNKAKFEAGISSEQYITHTAPDVYSADQSTNRISIPQRLHVRSVFLKLSYLC
jgi:Legionella pneumophila major outer membrane protein precursor